MMARQCHVVRCCPPPRPRPLISCCPQRPPIAVRDGAAPKDCHGGKPPAKAADAPDAPKDKVVGKTEAKVADKPEAKVADAGKPRDKAAEPGKDLRPSFFDIFVEALQTLAGAFKALASR